MTAVWNFPKTAIDVYSNTTGTGSQVDIIDIGSPIDTTTILGQLATVPRIGEGSPLPGSGSPATNTGKSYTPGSVVPTSLAVGRTLAYYEASSGSPHLADAVFGEVTSSIVFNSQLQAADTVELLYEPVSS